MGVVWKQVLTIMHLLFLTALGLVGLAQGNPYEYAVYNYDGSFYYPYGYYPGRTSYSYAPAVTHAYGNVDQSVATPYMYRRASYPVFYGHQARVGYTPNQPHYIHN